LRSASVSLLWLLREAGAGVGKVKAHAPGAFDDADLNHYAAALAADGGLRASLAYYRDAAEPARKNHQALKRRHLTVPILGKSAATATAAAVHPDRAMTGVAAAAWGGRRHRRSRADVVAAAVEKGRPVKYAVMRGMGH